MGPAAATNACKAHDYNGDCDGDGVHDCGCECDWAANHKRDQPDVDQSDGGQGDHADHVTPIHVSPSHGQSDGRSGEPDQSGGGKRGLAVLLPARHFLHEHDKLVAFRVQPQLRLTQRCSTCRCTHVSRSQPFPRLLLAGNRQCG